MNKMSTALMFTCVTIAAGVASAADVMKHHDATMKMDTLCKDMMAKDQLNAKKPGDQETPAKK